MESRHDLLDRRAARSILWILAIAPALAILVFYAGVLHARMILGYWPTNGHPDPKAIKTVLFALHYSTIAVSAVLTSLTPIAWIAALPMAEMSASLKSFCARMCVYLVSLVILLTLARIDPGGFVGWFMD